MGKTNISLKIKADHEAFYPNRIWESVLGFNGDIQDTGFYSAGFSGSTSISISFSGVTMGGGAWLLLKNNASSTVSVLSGGEPFYEIPELGFALIRVHPTNATLYTMTSGSNIEVTGWYFVSDPL